MGHGHCHLFSVYSLSLNYFPPFNSTIFNGGKRKKSNLPKNIYISKYKLENDFMQD